MDVDYDQALGIGVSAKEYFETCRAKKHAPVITCDNIEYWEREEKRKRDLDHEQEEDYYADESNE